MKKLNYIAFAAAGLLMASCSQEDFDRVTPGTEVTVSFDLSIPTAMGTRAYGDGTTSTNLQYAVYAIGDDGTPAIIDKYTTTDDEINLAKKLSFRLVTGQKYGLVFWAQSADEATPYTVEFTSTGATMNVDYTKTKANDENLDAFANYTEITVTGNQEFTAELRRPFAQINFGTNDMEEAKIVDKAPSSSRMAVSGIYKTLDLMTGDVSDPADFSYLYKYNTLPENEVFPVPGHDYITMVYALVPKDQSLVSVGLQHAVAGTAQTARQLSNVPVQRNYRTNIYGQVLTSTTDLNVIIVPEFGNPDNDVSGLTLAAILGQDISLSQNEESSSMITYRGTKTSLDLNDNDLSLTGGEGNIYLVGANTELTINGPGSITKSGTASDGSTSAIFLNNATAKAYINNVTVTSEGVEAIYIQKGIVEISGGYFACANPYPEGSENYFTLNCSDASAKDGSAKFIITGGTFENFNPAASNCDKDANGQPCNWVADGYTVIQTEKDGKKLYTVVPEGVEAVAESADDLIEALADEKGVVFMGDIKIDPASMSSGYGTTGINIKNGQTIDGNGYTLNIAGAGGTWDSGINTTGGLIQNLTITGSFRGVFINHNSTHAEKVVLKNVIIDGTVYTISCDQGTNNGIEATDCTFNGWTSYGRTTGNVSFTNCKFGESRGYKFCRPYTPTTFVNCDFCKGFQVDPLDEVTFENCRLNGVTLTADNIHTLVTNVDYVSVK